MNSSTSNEITIPDGWIREKLIAGIDTVGGFGVPDEYVGLGGGYKCDQCNHYVPIESIPDDKCPSCGTSGLIGTVIMGKQRITALYPEGWFDDDEDDPSGAAPPKNR